MKRIKKIHRLKTPAVDDVTPLTGRQIHRTLCDRIGNMFNVRSQDALYEIRCIEDDKVVKLLCTDTDREVTCITCARIIIGVPVAGPTKPKRIFHSLHLRNLPRHRRRVFA